MEHVARLGELQIPGPHRLVEAELRLVRIDPRDSGGIPVQRGRVVRDAHECPPHPLRPRPDVDLQELPVERPDLLEDVGGARRPRQHQGRHTDRRHRASHPQPPLRDALRPRAEGTSPSRPHRITTNRPR